MCNGIRGEYLQERLITSADNSRKKDAQAFGTHAGHLRGCQYGEDCLAGENGKQVEFLPERNRDGKYPDLQFDGQAWEVMFINKANIETIRKYIQHGKKADNLIFYWGPEYDRFKDLKEATKKNFFHAKENGSEIRPGIYYMYSLNGLTRLNEKVEAVFEKVTPTQGQKG